VAIHEGDTVDLNELLEAGGGGGDFAELEGSFPKEDVDKAIECIRKGLIKLEIGHIEASVLRAILKNAGQGLANTVAMECSSNLARSGYQF
jgi:hypothetical protein